MEVQGKIKQIGDVQTFGNNGFRKREVVITTEEQYPQHLMIEFVQDKTDLLNNYNSTYCKSTLFAFCSCSLKTLLGKGLALTSNH